MCYLPCDEKLVLACGLLCSLPASRRKGGVHLGWLASPTLLRGAAAANCWLLATAWTQSGHSDMSCSSCGYNAAIDGHLAEMLCLPLDQLLEVMIIPSHDDDGDDDGRRIDYWAAIRGVVYNDGGPFAGNRCRFYQSVARARRDLAGFGKTKTIFTMFADGVVPSRLVSSPKLLCCMLTRLNPLR